MATDRIETEYLQYREVEISVDGYQLKGNLHLPANADSLVIFSHGSGSSRMSTRNRNVASQLEDAGIGTFLCDLLTEREQFEDNKRFDIELLSQRLITITNWFRNHAEYSRLGLGFFGASTGAASALKASVELKCDVIKAVVSRGGRPDLISEDLGKITTPTLLIVGELDFEVIELNRFVYNKLTCPKQFVILPAASHLFEEPGKLEEVGKLAIQWFSKYFKQARKSKDYAGIK